MTDEREDPARLLPDLIHMDLAGTAALLVATSRRLLALAALGGDDTQRDMPGLVRGAAAEYDNRRARDLAFEDLPGLFGEPAWDILLDLFERGAAGQRTCVSSACIAASVPATTALRYIGALERIGLVEREPDARDRRRTYVRLTENGLTRMKAVFGS